MDESDMDMKFPYYIVRFKQVKGVEEEEYHLGFHTT